jgi:hypothetical protein
MIFLKLFFGNKKFANPIPIHRKFSIVEENVSMIKKVSI